MIVEEKFKLIDNSAANRYEIIVEDSTPFVEYIKTADKIILTHTEVPVKLKGEGIGTALVKLVLEDIQKKELGLIPLCPFVALYIKRHPEWKKLVLKDLNLV